MPERRPRRRGRRRRRARRRRHRRRRARTAAGRDGPAARARLPVRAEPQPAGRPPHRPAVPRARTSSAATRPRRPSSTRSAALSPSTVLDDPSVVRAGFDTVGRILRDGSFRLEDAEVRDDFRVVDRRRRAAPRRPSRAACACSSTTSSAPTPRTTCTSWPATSTAPRAGGSCPTASSCRRRASRRRRWSTRCCQRPDAAPGAGRAVGRAARHDRRGRRRRRHVTVDLSAEARGARHPRAAAARGAAGVDARPGLLRGAAARRRASRWCRTRTRCRTAPTGRSTTRPARSEDPPLLYLQDRRLRSLDEEPARERRDHRRPAGRRRRAVAVRDATLAVRTRARGRGRRGPHRTAARPVRRPACCRAPGLDQPVVGTGGPGSVGAADRARPPACGSSCRRRRRPGAAARAGPGARRAPDRSAR